MPFFTTVFARSSKILLEQVQALQLPSASSLLFSVSANTEPSVLSKVVSHFGQDENCIGCLAHSPLQSAVSCAVAAFPSSEVVSFRSTIKGLAPISLGKPRRPANPAAKYDQGGAWFDQLDDHAFKDTKFTNGSFLWGTSNNPNSVHVLPEGLEDVPVASIKNIVYFSDGAPEGLKSALDSRFPLAAQMGLIGSSTPFVTGRPYTLLQGSKVWSDGAVGLAFLKGGLTSTHAFHGYEAFSKTYTVSKAESNLIHSLDDQNPVKQLLAALPAIQGGTSTGSLGSFKDMEIYLGTFTSGSDRIYRLISGGPSKGILALESEDGPTEGTQVRFLYRPQGASHNKAPWAQYIRGMHFNSMAEDGARLELLGPQEYRHIESFNVYSENGLVISSSGRSGSWISSIPGARSSLSWPHNS